MSAVPTLQSDAFLPCVQSGGFLSWFLVWWLLSCLVFGVVVVGVVATLFCLIVLFCRSRSKKNEIGFTVVIGLIGCR